MKAKLLGLLLSVLLLANCLLVARLVFEQRQIVSLQQQVATLKEIITTKERENNLLGATKERFRVLSEIVSPSPSLLELAGNLEKLVDASGGQLTAVRTTGLAREGEWQVYEQEVEIEGAAGALATFLEQLRKQSLALVITSFTATAVTSTDSAAQGQNITGPLRLKAGIKYRLYLFPAAVR